jgi:periplasmic protein TonB
MAPIARASLSRSRATAHDPEGPPGDPGLFSLHRLRRARHGEIRCAAPTRNVKAVQVAVFHRSEPVLPEVPSHRSAAIASSVLGHAVLIAALLFLGRYAVEKEEEPVRLVFVEPAPPPKLGVPEGGATGAPQASEPAAQPEPPPSEALTYAPQPALFPPRPEPKPQPKPVTKPVAKPKRAPVQQAKPQSDGAPSDATAVAGATSGAPRGVADGQAAGVDGGLAGGQVGGLGSEIVPVRQAAVPPTVSHRVLPTYPESARLRGIEGQVMIEAVIARDGAVEPGVKVVQSIPALDDAAVEAFKHWRFTPARDASGQPLRVILQAPVRFVLR